MSYSNSFPQQRPTLNLDFANSGKLDSRLSYSRSSGGTFMSSEKALSSENLLLQSQDFGTSWTASGIAAPTGSQTSPTGDSTAWLLTATTFTAGSARVQRSMSIDTNTEYTMVAHVKAGTASHAFISFRGASTHSCSVTLNFATQALTNTAFIFTNVSSSVTALGNDWFKLTLTGTTGVFNSGPVARVGLSDGSAVLSSGNPSWNASGETIYAWGIQLSSVNSLVYDSPTTTQIAREYSPLLKTASANEPRFEFASNGQSVGLLIESSASNLQRYGSAFASWNYKIGSGLTANAAISPNGELEATLWTATSNSINHYLNDNFLSVTSGTTYTSSVYVKDAGQRYVQIAGGSTYFGSGQYATFDLQTGSVDANGVTASAQNVGNGWWRIQATMTATGTGSNMGFLILVDSATASRNGAFTADDYSGVLIFGYQQEEGSSASSLVDTGSQNSALSRAADSCSVATADFGFTGGPVTMVGEVSGSGSGYSAMAELRDTVSKASGVNDYMMVWKSNASDTDASSFKLFAYDNSTSQAAFTISGSGGATTIAARLDTNNVGACADGGAVTTDTSAVIPDSLDTLYIGRGYSGFELGSTIKRLAIYSAALSDTELQAITS